MTAWRAASSPLRESSACGDLLIGDEPAVRILRRQDLRQPVRRDGVRVDDEDGASLHPLIQHLARTRTRVPQQRDAATLSGRRRAGPSQCLVSGLDEQWGSVDDEGIRLHGDFREAVESSVQGTIPCEGEVLRGLGENVRPGVQRLGCFGTENIRDEKVSGEGTSCIENLPPHRPRCDLPKCVLPGLKSRVDASWCCFARAEQIGRKFVCQVVCDLR